MYIERINTRLVKATQVKVASKIFKWAIGLIGLLLLVLLIYGCVSQYLYDVRVAREFQPTGTLAQLPQNTMHYQLIGSGDFTFVLETGLGENIDTWKNIKDSLAQMGRVFMYDRSGLGFSEANEHARTTHQIAMELNRLLKSENIPGPYILVGHSIGGAHIRYYAHLFPQEVKGLFLIDASHEKLKDHLPPPSLMYRFFSFSARNLAWSGIPFNLLPKPPHPSYKTSKSIKAYGREIAAIDESITIFKSAEVDLSQLPIYIISATQGDSRM